MNRCGDSPHPLLSKACGWSCVSWPGNFIHICLCMPQVLTSTYSLEANLVLLRLYQFLPSAVKHAVVAKVLLKAVMQLPKPDFKVCIHLINSKLQVRGGLPRTGKSQTLDDGCLCKWHWRNVAARQ